MSETTVSSQPKMIAIEAVVIRANGKRENLGTISFWHRSFWRRLWWAIQQNWK